MNKPKKIKIADLQPFDVADHLKTEKDMAAYLSIMLEDGTPAEVAGALGAIARARGMAKLAEDAGLSRESLYKGLSGSRTPTASTLFRVIRALGLRLSVQAVPTVKLA